MLVVQKRKESWKCTPRPCEISTLEYLKDSCDGHAKSGPFRLLGGHPAAI